MVSKNAINVEAIAALENSDLDQLRAMTLDQRGELIALACRTAAQLEASRARMGLPPVTPSPWPASTWNFLAKAAANARKQ